MARSALDVQKIVEEIKAWCEEVIQPDNTTVITEYFRGKIIRDTFSLYRLRNKLMKVEEYAIDTEFTTFRYSYPGESDLVGVSICFGKYNNYYIPVGHLEDDEGDQVELEQFVRIMKPVFNRTNVRVIGHNLKAEMHILASHGLEIKTTDIFDTLVAVWNLDENNEVGLKEITWRYYEYHQRHFDELLLTIPADVKKQYGLKANQKGNAAMIKINHMSPYALDDTYWTWRIYLDVYDSLEEEGALPYFYKRQMPYLITLYKMERRGVKVDRERLQKMADEAEKDLERIAYQIYEIAGIEFNIASDDQLRELLFGWEKQKPIYKMIRTPVIDPKTNQQAVWKGGPRKGQLKFDDKPDKNVIVGQEFTGNRHIVDNSYKFPVQSTTDSGMPGTSADDLRAIMKMEYKRDRRKKEGQQLVKLLLKYARLEKLRGTYMVGMLEQIYADGKIRTSFNQTGTTSGRLSSSGPNLQNLTRPLEPVYAPKRENYETQEQYDKVYAAYLELKEEYDFWIRYEVRDVFIPDITPKSRNKDEVKPDEEVLTAHDFSNLEMRILTHFSQDPLLLKMFETDADAHGDTAVNMFELNCTPDQAKKLFPKERQEAKTINFLLVYGGSEFTLANSLGCTKERGKYLYDLYFSKYQGVESYIKGQKKYGHKHGIVYTLLARKRHLDGINAGDFKTQGYYERLSVNAPIQGSAADIAISAQLLIEADPILRRWKYRQVLQVHDEIVGVVPRKNVEKAEARVKFLMENCLPKPLNGIKLKADHDWGTSYAQAK